MKSYLKILTCLSIVVYFFCGCSKDDGPAPTPSTVPPVEQGITSPPSTFTKKAILEYHTAAWCSTCPDAEVKRDQVMNNYPEKVIPVAIHQADGMQIPLFMTLDASFGSNPTYGMINRVPSLGNVLLNRTQWMTNMTSQLNGQAKCGLAINSNVNGNTASIEVQVSFTEQISGTINLTVYLVESDVIGTGSGYDQANAYNTVPSSPFYNLGNPIVNYKHMYVVKKVLTANLGDLIEASKIVPAGLFKKNFTVDITGMSKNKTEIIAFVNKTGTTATDHQVFNVQKAKVGTLKNWD